MGAKMSSGYNSDHRSQSRLEPNAALVTKQDHLKILNAPYALYNYKIYGLLT